MKNKMEKLSVRNFALFLSLLLCCGLVSAESDPPEKKHPIDLEIDRLLDKDPSTHGQIRAADKGCELWDAELNRVWKELMSAVAPEMKEALKASQKQWLVFRDLEFKVLEAIYAKKEGTMWGPAQVFDRLDIIKARAKELSDRLALFRDQ